MSKECNAFCKLRHAKPQTPTTRIQVLSPLSFWMVKSEKHWFYPTLLFHRKETSGADE